MANDIIVPVIHLNGDRAEALMDQLGAVWDCLENARAALRAAGPNGRNYYPSPGRLEQAIVQHTRRLMAIDALQDELKAEMDAICEQTTATPGVSL